MANRNFARALSLVLKHEGGYVDNPRDPGGATNKGITLATYRSYVKANGSKADLRNITDEQVRTVYKKHYWDKVRGDDLPSGLDYAVFDFAVNSGTGRAARFLQTVVGATPDGAIGPKTLEAAGRVDAVKAIKKLCDNRLEFLAGLKTWGTFKNGWTRRVMEVEKAALDMAKASGGAPVPKTEKKTAGKMTLAAAIVAAVLGLLKWLFG